MTLEQPISRQKDLDFIVANSPRVEADRSLCSKQRPDLMRQTKFERESFLYIMRKYVNGTIDELSWNTAAKTWTRSRRSG